MRQPFAAAPFSACIQAFACKDKNLTKTIVTTTLNVYQGAVIWTSALIFWVAMMNALQTVIVEGPQIAAARDTAHIKSCAMETKSKMITAM